MELTSSDIEINGNSANRLELIRGASLKDVIVSDNLRGFYDSSNRIPNMKTIGLKEVSNYGENDLGELDLTQRLMDFGGILKVTKKGNIAGKLYHRSFFSTNEELEQFKILYRYATDLPVLFSNYRTNISNEEVLLEPFYARPIAFDRFSSLMGKGLGHVLVSSIPINEDGKKFIVPNFLFIPNLSYSGAVRKNKK